MSKPHKLLRIKIGAISLLLFCVPAAFAQISNIQVSNLTSSSATISWTTTDTTDGCVHYGLTTALGDTVCDPRPDDDIHFVQISGLSTDTTYYFEVESGGEIDSNGGSYYTFGTAEVGIGIPYTIYGTVDPAAGAIVSVVVKSQSGDSSCPLSALDDNLGVWFFNLGNLKDPTTNDVFSYSTGDSIFITAQAGGDGQAHNSTTVSGASPQGCDTLFLALRGDANGDGVINSADVVFLINYLFVPGSPAPDPLWVGDCNHDEIIDSADVVYLINYLFVPGSPQPLC